ncbi:MAG: TRAP transporter substrate-binding protein [Spirochaetales bacterium]|nr:TRAP transporter substrate-binding protein [Spirochaetales bacterium]
MLFFKKKLEQVTNGRIVVELYFSGILGKESEVLTMVHQGIIQGCRGGLFYRANQKYFLLALPFFFENIEQFARLMESDFGKQINKDSLRNGYYIPACGIAGGFRNITSNQKPIRSPDDFQGLKIRTPPLDITMKTFSVLGAIPEQIPYTETYLALAQGIVDAQENPYSNIVDMKFYEVQTYLSVLNWQLHPDPFYVNPDWYNALPPDLKLAFDTVAAETMAYSDEIWLNSEEEYFDFLKDKLTVNHLTQGVIDRFKKAVKPVWQYYVDAGFFSWKDIETAQQLRF